jgi:hypothetical protein
MTGWASGRDALSHCYRCGFYYEWKEMQQEPGTLQWVCDTCNDRGYSLVSHPQNKAGDAAPDPQAIPHPNPERIRLTWASPEMDKIPWAYFRLEWQEITSI